MIHYAQEAGMQPVAGRFMLDRGRLTTREVIVVSVTLMLNVLLPSWCSFLALFVYGMSSFGFLCKMLIYIILHFLA